MGQGQADIAMQLKSTVNVDKLQLEELVSKARAMLASKGGSTSALVCAGVGQVKSGQCFVCSGNAICRECPNNKRIQGATGGGYQRDR